jgi:hypothetical protein
VVEGVRGKGQRDDAAAAGWHHEALLPAVKLHGSQGPTGQRGHPSGIRVLVHLDVRRRAWADPQAAVLRLPAEHPQCPRLATGGCRAARHRGGTPGG